LSAPRRTLSNLDSSAAAVAASLSFPPTLTPRRRVAGGIGRQNRVGSKFGGGGARPRPARARPAPHHRRLRQGYLQVAFGPRCLPSRSARAHSSAGCSVAGRRLRLANNWRQSLKAVKANTSLER
jgi:hypothetical protein